MKTFGINIVVLLGLLLVLEIVARVFVSYEPGFYTGVAGKEDSCVEYPYGEICFNNDGFPSSEFSEIKDKPTIGYFGDSVCFGVGAGMGFRVTDLLEQSYPQYYHRNYCYIGDTPLKRDSIKAMRKKLHTIDHLVIFFNLNDLAPLEFEQYENGKITDTSEIKDEIKSTHSLLLDSTQSESVESDDHALTTSVAKFSFNFRRHFYPVDEFLRGRLYIYNIMRTHLKNWLSVRGIEATGYVAKELFPHENIQLIKHVASTVNTLSEDIYNQSKVRISIVLLPYEMQAIEASAPIYREAGIQWEKGFLNGTTQQLLSGHLNDSIRVFDALDAFTDVRDAAQIGEYFVYNLGDKLDWNHPNRQGHKLIHQFLVKQLFLDEIL